MKTGFIFVSAIVIASTLNIANAEDDGKHLSEKARLAKMQLQIRAGGGKVEKPGTKKGCITLVNTQNSAKEDWIKSEMSYLASATRLDISIQTGKFVLPAPEVIGEFSIYIVDDSKLPHTLVAQDNHWAIVNVAPLKTEKMQYYEARVKKQISRVFSLLCGGMSSDYALSVATPVASIEDIDAMPSSEIPFDVLNKIPIFLGKFGVAPAVVKTYRMACKEGWAAPPTNEVQRIIWNEVRQLPSNPIKIEFDPKKGK